MRYACGVVEEEREVILELPPGAQDGDTFELYLGKVGIENLLLQVRVSVTGSFSAKGVSL